MSDSQTQVQATVDERAKPAPLADALCSVLETRSAIIRARARIASNFIVTAADTAKHILDARAEVLKASGATGTTERIRDDVSSHLKEVSSSIQRAADEIRSNT